ncbi:MAG TPA: S66 peptidase family protein [Streptosporangiaceae bacterium]|jgi:muramoyltetrapeptide carboxypeptidase LdcA involved in peptidoglycan recycling
MDAIYPAKLAPGDLIRVIAPSRSRAMVAEHDHTAIIEDRFAGLGLRLSYGEHVDERNALDSAPVGPRVADLHAAFADPQVAGILTVIGGYNSNELLPYLDWELIRANPKVFCGYSDITALHGAISARTGLVSYLGPHWSSFGMARHFDQTLRWFSECLLGSAPVRLAPASQWTDDLWFIDQEQREVLPGEGWWPLQPGTASGRLAGGNLATITMLPGTPYMPSLADAVLVVEDDAESQPAHFARNLTFLLQQPDAATIRGLVIGRFQRASNMTRPLLEQIIAAQPRLAGLPVLANADFGHTSPMATIPLGGEAELCAGPGEPGLVLTRH